MKKAFSHLITIAATFLLTACGGGGDSNMGVVATPLVPVAAISVVTPTDEVSVVTTKSTTEEIVESLKTVSGLFVNSNTDEMVKVAPGQGYVTLVSFTRTEKFREYYGFSLQPVTQLVFVNRTDSNIADVMNEWDVSLKYGYQNMYPTVPYYVEMWKTEKESGVTVTFYNGWYGEIPAIGFGLPFHLEGSIKNTAAAGSSVALELIHIHTAKVTSAYEVDSGSPFRTIVVDPLYIPVDSGKG